MLAELRTFRPVPFELVLDGELWGTEAMLVAVGNSASYGGGMRAAPGAMLDDGLLDVVVLENVPKLTFLTKILPRVFKGEHLREPRVHVLRAREITVSADRPFTMYADGDPIGELPLRVRALPGAINVIVPADSGLDSDSAFTGAAPAPPPAQDGPSERTSRGGPPEER